MKHRTLFSVIYSLILLLSTYFFLGYYYGWIDDVLVSNYLMGIPIYQPIEYTFNFHLLLSKLYRFLYDYFHGIPWIGIAFALFIFLATVNFIYFLIIQFSEFFEDYKWLFAIFVTIIYFLIWVENVYLLNFSKLAILLTGISFLNIHKLIRAGINKKGILVLIYFCCTFMIGLFTRMEVTFILFPFLLIFSFQSIMLRGSDLRITGILVGFYVVGIAATFLFSEGDATVQRQSAHILNIVDGLNTYNPDIASVEKNAKSLALFHYFFPDSIIINSDYLNSLGPASPLNILGLKYLKRNLLSEYRRATYYTPQYHQPLNWFWKMVAFSAINLLLLLVSIYQTARGKSIWMPIFFQTFSMVAFYSTIFIVTVLSKMEDRVLTPALIIFTIAHFSLWIERNKTLLNALKTKVIVLIFTTLILLTVWRTVGYLKISAEKKDEVALKREVLKELNEDFTGKILFYDIWAMTLLHQTPLETIQLNPQNIHTCYGEYWSNMFLEEHKKYLKQLCGKTDFISFYRCLYEKRDQVVFVYSKIYRKELIEKYAMEVYNQKIKFKQIKSDSKLKNIHYSFLWGRNDFGYYVFDKSFEDAD